MWSRTSLQGLPEESRRKRHWPIQEGLLLRAHLREPGVRRRHLTWLILVRNNLGREMVGSWAV